MRWESGPLREPGVVPDKAAILAHWSPDPEVSRSVCTLVAELAAAGYDVVVSSAGTSPEPLKWTHLPAGAAMDRVSVYRRQNVGYDFGSWAQALDLLPGLREARVTILLNDSLLGPFRPLAPVIGRMEADRNPVWGLVNTTQDAPHLQSHFVAYRDGVLNHPRLRRFWDGIRVQPTKQELIRKYEIGLARELRRAHLATGVGFDWERVVRRGGNPTSQGWRRLLLWGFPFVKRELVLRPPPEVPDAADIPAVVRDMFSQDVMEWV